MTAKRPRAGLTQLQKNAEQARISDLPVTEFMGPVEVTILDGSRIYTAVQTLVNHRLTGAPVVDKSGRLVGMVSEYDLLLQASTRDLAGPIKYSTDVVSLPPTATLKDCIISLYRLRIRRIPIVDRHRRVMGIVSRMDVLRRLITSKH